MSSSGVTPRVFAHSSRPEWGRAVIAEEQPDRTIYVFESGGERTLLNSLSRLEEVELPPEERETLAKTLLRGRGPAKTRSGTRTIRKKAPELTFDQQEAIFARHFPGGFEDEKFVQSVRGEGVDALIALAGELFAAPRLDEALERGAFAEVHADGKKLIAAGQQAGLVEDAAVFDEMPAEGYEKIARALRDLLHGKKAYTSRFNAFVKSIAPKGVPWTVATVFAAAVHPDAHVLVTPATSRRQARAVEATLPSNGAPTGAGYKKHLAVAEALRERLKAAGKAPRDMFDVYAYSMRTLESGTR